MLINYNVHFINNSISVKYGSKKHDVYKTMLEQRSAPDQQVIYKSKFTIVWISTYLNQ